MFTFDQQTIREHVGVSNYVAGKRLISRGYVLRNEQSGGTLRGEVYWRANSTCEVNVYSEGLSIISRCTCKKEKECEHVAAILIQQLDSSLTESRFVPRSMSKAKFYAWAKTVILSDVVECSVRTLGEDCGPLARFYPTIGSLFYKKEPSRLPSKWKARLPSLINDVDEWLRDFSSQRQTEKQYYDHALTWRRCPPAEVALQPLWRALFATHESAGLFFDGCLDLPVDAQFSLDADPLTLHLINKYDEEQRYSLTVREPDLQLAPLWAVGVTLDLLCAPGLSDSPKRAALLKEIKVRPWERALGDFDRLFNVSPESSTPERGWQIYFNRYDDLRLSPVTLTPYKTRSGFRARRQSLEDFEPSTSIDHAIVRLLETIDESIYNLGFEPDLTPTSCAIAQLVGHPVVVDKSGNLLAVREQTLSLNWVPTDDGGLRLIPTFQHRVLSDAERKTLCESPPEVPCSLYNAEGLECIVVRLSAQAIGILQTLNQRGDTFPLEARDALLDRFGSISTKLPMHLSDELRGEQLDADPRPLIRLTLERDGILELEVLVCPIPSGPAFQPGEGPEQVYHRVNERRVFAKRALNEERARVDRALQPLGLPSSADYRWLFDDIDEGLDLIRHLQDATDRFSVEWTHEKARIRSRASVDTLRIQGRKKREWFGIDGGLEVDGFVVPLADLLRAVRGNRRYVSVGKNEWITLGKTLRDQLEGIATLARETKTGLNLPPIAGTTLLALEAEGAEVKMPKSLRVQIERLHEANQLQITLPKGLNATLRSYQLDGFRWLCRLAHWAPGAVLADDMGLGKTVQALALLLRRSGMGPALVVAPASVGVNWTREAARFAPSLRVISYRGAQRKKILSTLKAGDLLITSWELMTRDVVELSESSLATVVLDEAQAIKNPNTKRARASTQLNAPFTLALTGTPVENRCGELWSLMRTAVPGLLGPAAAFRERFVLPIEGHGEQQPRRALAKLLRPFLLRRLKSEVALDLPQRSDAIIPIELSASERRRYDTFRLASLAELNKPATPGDKGKSRFRILAAITRLRQLACHPGLVDKKTAPKSSSKLDRLLEMLLDLQAGQNQALVFSQFTTLLKLAKIKLEAAGLTVRYLDGSVSLKKRQIEVDAFQAGQGDVFLISLKAGGTGLNLTAASYVFHLDPWWNPAVEDQATDRAHRIGQTQPVMVFRLVATDTIEEQVLAMHGEKRALVADLLHGTSQSSPLSPGELMTLLGSD